MKKYLPALAALALLTACGDSNTYVEPPPPKVTVAKPAVEEVIDYLYFTGTTQAAAVVDVRARVPGTLQTISFTPGTEVKAGDPLFIIDQREYIADLEIAKANVKSARASKIEADKALERANELIKRGNVSQAKLDESEAAARTATANVSVAEAAQIQAELDLEYTEITAPISGRIGRNLVDAGNLVGEGEATLLAVITASDPMYVYFTINERDLLAGMEQYRKDAMANSDTPEPAHGKLKVEMATSNQEDYPFVGILDFAESALNPNTGTLQLRARFDNPGPFAPLISGLFARVRVPITQRPDIPLVTERAIGLDQGGRYVYVVDAEGVVEKRNVTVGQLVDGLRVIEDGLEPTETVVVNGIQRVRDGSKVTAEQGDMAAFTASALVAARQQGGKAPARSGDTGQTTTQ
jgi:RND family efflux transporter MFP subunit